MPNIIPFLLMVVEIWYHENCQKVKNPVKQRKVVPFRRSCHTYLSILFIAFCGRYCYCRWWWCARWDCWNRPHCDVSLNKNSNGDFCLCLFKASHTLSGKKTVIWMRLDKPACVVLLQIIKVPCSGKLPQIRENTIFAEKICADCWLLPHQRMPHPLNFVDKTFANSHKLRNSQKVFSLKSFPLHGIA